MTQQSFYPHSLLHLIGRQWLILFHMRVCMQGIYHFYFSLNVPLSTDFFLMFIYGNILHVPPPLSLTLSRIDTFFFFFFNRLKSTHCITITQNHHAINGRKSAWESDSFIMRRGAMDSSKINNILPSQHSSFFANFPINLCSKFIAFYFLRLYHITLVADAKNI